MQAASAATLRKLLRTEGQLLEDHSDDVTMCRFLRARKWDVPKAQLMYTNMAQWRGTLQLDHPNHEFHSPEEHLVKQHYPHFYHKTDKFGRPIYYELLGEMNATELLKATSVERLIRYYVHCRERAMRDIMPACSNAVGRRVFTCVTILDLKGVSGAAFNSAVRAFLREVSQLDQVSARVEGLPVPILSLYVVLYCMLQSAGPHTCQSQFCEPVACLLKRQQYNTRSRVAPARASCLPSAL